MIGGPLSGWIMHSLQGAMSMAGWKWLFLLEALPSLVLGFAILLFVLGIIFTSNATSTPKTTSDGLTSYKGKKLNGPLVIHATGQ